MVYWCVPNPIILYSILQLWHTLQAFHGTEDQSLCSAKSGIMAILLPQSTSCTLSTLTAFLVGAFLEPSPVKNAT